MSDVSDFCLTMSERKNRTKYKTLNRGMKAKKRHIAEDLVKLRKKTEEDNRINMLLSIKSSEPNGLTTNELTKKLQCHRDTIHSIGKKLCTEGMVTKQGKFGKYHLQLKALEDPELRATVFGSQIMNKFYELGGGPLCIRNRFCNKRLSKKALTIDENTSEDLIDRISFFEFALRLGAIMTYELIQAMRYTQDPPLNQQSTLHNDKINNNLKNEYMFKYIMNLMKPSSLLFILRDLNSINKRLKPYDLIEVKTNKEEEEKYQHQLESLPAILELQDTKFEEVEKIFKESFPQLFKDLEKMKKLELPNEINKRADWRLRSKHSFDEMVRKIKQLTKDDPDHIKCDGKLLLDIKASTNQRNVLKCTKCYRWIRVKKQLSSSLQ